MNSNIVPQCNTCHITQITIGIFKITHFKSPQIIYKINFSLKLPKVPQFREI